MLCIEHSETNSSTRASTFSAASRSVLMEGIESPGNVETVAIRIFESLQKRKETKEEALVN